MRLKLSALLVAAMTVALVFCASAGAANVVLGPTFDAPFMAKSCEEDCTLFNLLVEQRGAELYSPVNGVILGWSLIEGVTPGDYHLRIADRGELGTFHFASTTPGFQSAAVPGVQTFNFADPIPIKKNQAVGLQMSETASVGFAHGIGNFVGWAPSVPDGTTDEFPWLGENEVVGFNVEIQPEPVPTGMSVTSGPSAGDTELTITGTDLEGATEVEFGAATATIVADSEHSITVLTPPMSNSTAEKVLVITAAGSGYVPRYYEYVVPPSPPSPSALPTVPHCVVPELKGKSVKDARFLLIKAHCGLGKVKRLKGAKSKSGKVVRQGVKPGIQMTAAAKVGVTLKPAAKAAGMKVGR
jgi:hypothetical protein